MDSLRKAYFSTISGSILIQLSGIASGILSARLLGPNGRGMQVVIVLIPTLVMSLGNLSLPFATAYMISKQPKRTIEIAASVFWLSLFYSLILTSFAFLFLSKLIPTEKAEVIPTLSWYLWWIPCAFIGMSLLGIDHGRQAFIRYNLLRILIPAVYVFGMVFLWSIDRVSLEGFVACSLASVVIVAVIRTVLFGRWLSPLNVRWNIISELLKRGFLLHVPTIAGMVLMNIDRIILTRLVENAALGYYAGALAVAMGQYGIASAFMQVSFVKLAAEKEPEEGRKQMARHIRYAQVLITAVAVALLIVAPYLIPFVFGEEFIPSIRIAYPLILAMAFFGIGIVFDNSMRGLGHPIPSSIGNILGLAIAVVFGILLVPKYKGLGMALAMLIAMSSMLTYFICYSCYVLQIPPKELWGFRIDVVRQICKALSDIFSRVILSRSVPIEK